MEPEPGGRVELTSHTDADNLTALLAAALRRAELIQALTAGLAPLIDEGEVATFALELAMRALDGQTASLCMLVTDDQLAIMASAGYSPEVVATWGRFPLQADLPASEAVRTGDPVFIHSAAERDERYPVFATSAVVDSAAHAVVPLTLSDGRTLGALVIGFADPHDFPTEDRLVILALAGQVAVAIERARLYREKADVARALQASLLPPLLPAIDGMQIAARYLPLGSGAEVGGDFYDLFQVRPDEWLLTVGDVCGKGVYAAATSGLARHVLRARSVDATTPSQLLERINDVLVRDGAELTAHAGHMAPEPCFCTLVVALLRVGDAGVQLTLASAGHPLPLLLRDGELSELGVYGPMAGVSADSRFSDTVVELRPDDTVILFTDGISERRNGDEFFGEGAFYDVLEGLGLLPAEAIATEIEKAVTSFGAGPLTDDLALVVLRTAAHDDLVHGA